MLAVDLSVASLCYAKRQALALGLTNIAFAEADILELASIDRKFDIVDASGVLHHVANPWVGWRVLLSLLRPNGFMRVGLYSKLARADVNAARAFVKERGYAATAEDIRRSRQDILALPEGEVAKDVANSPDFFTTSECRDLLFHVQEHRLTIPEIKSFIGENGLMFIGFEFAPRMTQYYRDLFGGDRLLRDLDHWHRLEVEKPDTFAGMYQFWLQKN